MSSGSEGSGSRHNAIVSARNNSNTIQRKLRFDVIDSLPQSKLDDFHKDGWCVIDEFLSESEVSELEEIYDQFIRGEIHVEGKDFCDMSQKDGYFTSLEDMRMINAMLPRIYYPKWQNNIYEQKTRALIDRLYPKEYGMDIDYDQLLAKKPQQSEAVFSFHQDAAYWPNLQGRMKQHAHFISNGYYYN